MQTRHVGRINRMQTFDYINYGILTILSAIFMYPLLQTLAISFSDDMQLIEKEVYLLPAGFSLDAYKILLSDLSIWRYYANTVFYMVLGTFLTLLLCSLLAYPLTFKDFRGRKFCTILLIITMFVSGGMIPTYLVIMKYQMLNTFWALVLPGAVGAYNVILFRTAFMGIPDSLRESAYIDGASHFRVLFNIVLPLSKSVLACIALFTAVSFWNGYLSALIYLDDGKKMPIQIFLRRILVLMDYNEKDDMMKVLQLKNANPRSVKGAATIISLVPILCVYPFAQKYFATGIMVGSVKE